MNIVIVVLEDFPGGDTRVRRQVQALTGRGHDVTVLCARAYSKEADWMGCRIVRTWTGRKKAASMSRRLLEYILFSLEVMIRLTALSMLRRFDVIQVANMPDFLTLSALPARILMRSPIVLDMHDLMPELLGSKLAGSRWGLAALYYQESISFRLAKRVMTVNGICAALLKQRHVGRDIEVIPNCPDASTFVRRNFLWWQPNEVVRIGYHGTVARRFGVHTLILALEKLLKSGRKIQLDVWGGGEELAEVKQLALSCGVSSCVQFHGQTPVDRMVLGLKDIHISVVPYEKDPYMAIAYSTKAFELALMGIPMVLADLAGLREQFSEQAARYFAAGNADDLAFKLSALIDEGGIGAQPMVEVAMSEVSRFDWAVYAKTYVDLLEQVAACR